MGRSPEVRAYQNTHAQTLCQRSPTALTRGQAGNLRPKAMAPPPGQNCWCPDLALPQHDARGTSLGSLQPLDICSCCSILLPFLPSQLQLSSNLTCPSPGGSSAASSRMSALIHRECPLSPNPSRGQAPQPCPACALAVAASSASPTAWPSSKVCFLSCVQWRVGEGRGRGSYTFTESTCYHYSGQVARVRW